LHFDPGHARSDSQALRREGAGDVAVLHAFDLMELHGSDLHSLPIETRKATLASLLRNPPRGASVPALLHR
jgi:ATP-dependent DNA ligase